MENEPNRVQVLDQLEKIVSSDGFVSSPRKRKFLRYIVEKTLDGEAASLKGYALGVDVFDRGEGFDPQADTIVRVQARNLRRALEFYNLSHGQDDAVKIDLHKGSYVPVFSFNEPLRLEAEPIKKHLPVPVLESVEKNKNVHSHKYRLLVSALFMAFFGALAWVTVITLGGNGKTENGFEQAAHIPLGPTIVIEPFRIITSDTLSVSDAETSNLQNGLHIELVDKVSRFKDLFVIESRHDTAPGGLGANNRKTQFELTGTIQRSGDDLRVISILKQKDSGEVLWTRSHSETLESPSALLKIQSDIAVDVAASLGQPYSRINSRFMAEQSNLANLQLDHYFCLMGFYNYLQAKTEPEHKKIRTCLEKSTAEMPGFSSGWAALSWMYSDEQFNNFNLRSGDAPPKQRALLAAQRAVDADPDNAMAHQYLAIIKFRIGDDAGFLEAAETALRLNPNDAEVLADVGSHLIQLENSEQGRIMVEKAIAMNPAHPAWYHGSIFTYFYTRKEADTALHHASEYLRDGSLSAHMQYTVALVQNEKIEEAQKAYSVLVDTYPHFPNAYQRILNELRIPDGMYEQLLNDLTLAGLSPVL